MQKEILEKNVYYYTDVIEDFDNFKKVLAELDELGEANESDFTSWYKWTSSNDDTFVYGETKSFSPNQINKLSGEIAEKSKYIYDAIMKAFYNVCKDYASSIGDAEEPKIFPSFNIKKYYKHMGMGSHFDQLDGDQTLKYSLVMYLNDDCQGGEISFQLKDYNGGWNGKTGWVHGAPEVDLDYDKAVKNESIDFGIKPDANSVIIFPSAAPYFHTAHTVKSGVKYMVPGHWIYNNV